MARANKLSFLLVWALLSVSAGVCAEPDFPRLMGMNIGAKHYDDVAYQRKLARLDVAILGFYKGWNPDGYAASPTAAMRKVLQAIKARNPDILLGQYTILSEAHDNPRDPASADLRDKLQSSNWWLLNAAGRKVQGTSRYSTWEVNFTKWTEADAGGRRWPEWLAERNHRVFFRDVPELDIVFLDGVISPLRVTADWNRDKRDDNRKSPTVLAAHFAGHLAHWVRLRELAPELFLIGNADNDLDNPQWRNQLDGAFLEGMMGHRWSIESWGGWESMMSRYRAVMENTRAPKIVGFNVAGTLDDYRFFRYAYASCLMDDGYFSFTDSSREYSSVPWFDEYDYRLGQALSKPPTAAWRDGVWRRDFEHGIVLVNPGPMARTIRIEEGFRRLSGDQDARTNDGTPAAQVRLAPRDGLVLRR